MTLPRPSELLTPEYRELIETASLDWQVMNYCRLARAQTEHSANEIKAAAIAEIGTRQHGEEFVRKVLTFNEPTAAELERSARLNP